MNPKKKILFITHEVSRTGAPLTLFYLMEWLKQNKPGLEISLLSLKGGGLRDKFKDIADNYYEIAEIKYLTFFQKFKIKVSQKLNWYNPLSIKGITDRLQKENFDLIYANSVVSLPVAKKIKLSGYNKLMVHVHELPSIITINCPQFKKFVQNVDLFIAVSKLVEVELMSNYDIPNEKIARIYEFTRIMSNKKNRDNSAFIVGGAGTVHWRKGSDLFIQVARYLKKMNLGLDFQFVWIGKISRTERTIAESDIRKAGLQDRVFFLGEKDNPGKFLKNLDVFILPSREDPFPLVAIEAGMLGKPIICFEGATGTEEIIAKGGGEIVPYLDIEAMACEIVNYYNNRIKLENDGATAQRLFSKFTPEIACPLIYNEIKKI